MVIKVYDRGSGEVVVGLRELQRELRAADPELAKRLQQINKRLVDEVAAGARSRIYRSVNAVSPSESSSPVRRGRRSTAGLSRAKASIRASASGREARIIYGGARVPSAFGFEFGGRGKRTTQQFPRHRGKQGYFLYPTVREEVQEAEKRWNALFDEVFPEGLG